MVTANEVLREKRDTKLFDRHTHPRLARLVDYITLFLRILLLIAFLVIIYALYRSTSFDVFAPMIDSLRGKQSSVQTTADNRSPSAPESSGSLQAVSATDQLNLGSLSTASTVAASPEQQFEASLPAALPDRVNVKGPAWILAQEAGTYTIQFSSSANLEKLVALSSQFESGQQVTIFPFKRKDDDIVYGLASGLYEDFASANAEIQKMPGALTVNDPWIRATEVLQQEISQFRTQ